MKSLSFNFKLLDVIVAVRNAKVGLWYANLPSRKSKQKLFSHKGGKDTFDSSCPFFFFKYIIFSCSDVYLETHHMWEDPNDYRWKKLIMS